MSWRERLSTLFVSNPIPEDPDEPVEIGVLPIAKGPVAVTLLIEAGFDAVGHDAFNIVTNVSSGFRILVPRHQSEQAARFLDETLREPSRRSRRGTTDQADGSDRRKDVQ